MKTCRLILRKMAPLALVGGIVNFAGQAAQAGHYEKTEHEEQRLLMGQYQLLPELGEETAILISRNVVQYQGHELVLKLLKNGATSIRIIMPKNMEWYEGNELFMLKRVMDRQNLDWTKIHFVQHRTPGWQTIWARDWGPLALQDDAGSFAIGDVNYDPINKADDDVPAMVADSLNLDRVSLPLYVEGGNLLKDVQGRCHTTDAIVKANSTTTIDSDKVYNLEEIKGLLVHYFGCKEVQVFPRMPHEATGHIDMWAKVLDAGNILIGELWDDSIDTLPEVQWTQAKEIQTYLREQQQYFANLGFKVHTVPMPAPLLEKRIFRSYTNSLRLGEVLLTPRYVEGRYYKPGVPNRSEGFEYPDVSLLPAYEKRVAAVLSEIKLESDQPLGLDWVVADELIGKQGAIHCATMQLPEAIFSR